MKLYRANLAREAKNQFIQGEKLDEYLLYEKGIEAQERGTTRFAEAIGEQIGKNMRTVRPVDKIKAWAGADDVDEFGNVLSKNAPKGKSPVVGDVDEFGNVLKAKSKNAPKSIKQPSKPKTMISNNRELENEMMGMEDKLSQLNEKKDKELRQMVMDELDDMYDAAKREEERSVINRFQDLIERQRMVDAFQQFSEDASKNEYASKLQRNLKILLGNKKLNRLIDAKATKAKQRAFDILKEENQKFKAGTTIATRLAELRARKRADSSSTASTASLSPPNSNESQKKKRGPKGRPKGTLSAKQTEEVLNRLGIN